MRMLLNVSIPHEPFKAAALHSVAAGRTARHDSSRTLC